MITVTRLNHVPFAVNPDLIERINADPDTTLTMVDGVRYVVTETMAEVIDRIAGYRAEVLERAYRLGWPADSGEGS
ncbi:flagellar FlbD family protein [Streptomyces sp. L7]|uniref:flagellar FlbD family protein n=1 Tax=Streptomyces sp. L7 TaxID=3423954 RepID=UPI003D9918EC